MPFRLSTLFLIVVATAFPLALLGTKGEWGYAIWIDTGILSTALCIYSITHPLIRSTCVLFLVFFGIICPIFAPAIIAVQTASRRALCTNNLHQIGHALQKYHKMYGNFPPAYTRNKVGKVLFSWRVEILPFTDYNDIFNSLKRDEPWNSEHNSEILNQVLPYYKCPSADRESPDSTTNYMAVIGPGTAWREDAPVKLSDLPDGGSHTVVAMEVVNSGVHWAEPFDLTVDEALKRMTTRKGVRISTRHPTVIQVLFADGTVRSLRSKRPLSMWKALLAGEVKDLEEYNDIDESAPDMVDLSANESPSKFVQWLFLLIPIGWLFSVALLFYRASINRQINSRTI
jgi:hypothetical protein